MRYRPSASRSSCCGIGRYGDEANVDGSTGTGWTGTRLDGFPKSGRCIPTRTCALQPEPEAGARCGSSARRDPCGGPPARAVPTATPELSCAVAEVYEKVPRLLSNPSSGRVRGDAQQVHAASSVLYHEQHIQPLQEQRVDTEEICGKNASGLHPQEMPPARPSRRGAGPMPARFRIDHTVLGAIW
jgi:hypothetical protein